MVTAAAGLLFAAALDALVLAVLALVWLGRLRAAARVVYDARADVDQLVSSLTTGTVATVVGLVAMAVVLAGCAVFDLRGSRITRYATWVATGLGVFCCGGSGLADRFSDDPVVALAYPGWYQSLHGWLVFGLVVAVAVASGLLVLPPANRYFRPRLVPAPTE